MKKSLNYANKLKIPYVVFIRGRRDKKGYIQNKGHGEWRTERNTTNRDFKHF